MSNPNQNEEGNRSQILSLFADIVEDAVVYASEARGNIFNSPELLFAGQGLLQVLCQKLHPKKHAVGLCDAFFSDLAVDACLRVVLKARIDVRLQIFFVCSEVRLYLLVSLEPIFEIEVGPAEHDNLHT